MEVKIIKSSKDQVDIELNSVTVAEVIRSYLYEQGIDFAAWKREHPSHPVILSIKNTGGGINKMIKEAIVHAKKDSAILVKSLKK